MPRAGAIEYAEPITFSHVLIRTIPCVVCDKQHEFEVSKSGYESWQHGDLIQDAFPNMSEADRETLISGTCSDCFDELWKEMSI